MATIVMDAATARERIIHFLEEIEDTCVISLYEFLKVEMNEEEDDFIYTGEVKTRIEKVRDDYTNGRLENFLTEEQFHGSLEQLRSGK